MNIDHDLKELYKAFELVDKHCISPLTALGIVDKENAAKDKAEFEQTIDDLYKVVLADAYGGDTNFMARSLLGYLCVLSVQGKLRQMPKVETTKTGRPPNSWGEDGKGKLAIFALVQYEITKKAEAGVKLKIRDALWEITKLDKNKSSNKKTINALASAYSEGKAKVIKDRANKVTKSGKKL